MLHGTYPGRLITYGDIFRTERTHPTVFRGWLRGLSDRRGAAYGVDFPVTLQDRACVNNGPAIVFEGKSVCSDNGLEEDGRDAFQLLALGTGSRVMGRIIFFRFKVEIKRDVTPPDKD